MVCAPMVAAEFAVGGAKTVSAVGLTTMAGAWTSARWRPVRSAKTTETAEPVSAQDAAAALRVMPKVSVCTV